MNDRDAFPSIILNLDVWHGTIDELKKQPGVQVQYKGPAGYPWLPRGYAMVTLTVTDADRTAIQLHGIPYIRVTNSSPIPWSGLACGTTFDGSYFTGIAPHQRYVAGLAGGKETYQYHQIYSVVTFARPEDAHLFAQDMPWPGCCDKRHVYVAAPVYVIQPHLWRWGDDKEKVRYHVQQVYGLEAQRASEIVEKGNDEHK
ncbi:hypothetical protein D6833_10075 [Candidatus Parcubacteria bacterium]|nr:MAG: hypothetical protein D6833_10075 [Candidatus Parcubacteria bacterium]